MDMNFGCSGVLRNAGWRAAQNTDKTAHTYTHTKQPRPLPCIQTIDSHRLISVNHPLLPRWGTDVQKMNLLRLRPSAVSQGHDSTPYAHAVFLVALQDIYFAKPSRVAKLDCWANCNWGACTDTNIQFQIAAKLRSECWNLAHSVV